MEEKRGRIERAYNRESALNELKELSSSTSSNSKKLIQQHKVEIEKLNQISTSERRSFGERISSLTLLRETTDRALKEMETSTSKLIVEKNLSIENLSKSVENLKMTVAEKGKLASLIMEERDRLSKQLQEKTIGHEQFIVGSRFVKLITFLGGTRRIKTIWTPFIGIIFKGGIIKGTVSEFLMDS
jgi:hypothetical protein